MEILVDLANGIVYDPVKNLKVPLSAMSKDPEIIKMLEASRASLRQEPIQNLIKIFPDLTPAQRRVIHMALSEDSEIETESQGEGEERYLVVKPKK